MKKISFQFDIKRTMLVLTIVTILILFAVLKVAAGSSNTIPKYGFLGSVTAYAQIRSFPSQQQNSAQCDIRSYTSPLTTINVIGWRWWQCDTLVNGNYYDDVHRGGHAPSASSQSDIISWPGGYAPPVNGLKAHGVHDFNHTGSNPSPWTPYNVNVFP